MQTDGYPAYVRVMEEHDIDYVLCNVHALSMFSKVIKSRPGPHDVTTGHANVVIDYYKQRDQIEAECRMTLDQTDPAVWCQQRLARRQQNAQPIY